jgi:hypothetical protein
MRTLQIPRPCPVEPCPVCKQTGFVVRTMPPFYSSNMPPSVTQTVPCESCGGYGWNWKGAHRG